MQLMFFFIIPLPLSFPTGLPWVCPDLPRGAKWKRGGDPDRKLYSPWGLVCRSSGDRQQLSRRGHSIKSQAGQRQSFQKHNLKREISVWKSSYFLKKKKKKSCYLISWLNKVFIFLANNSYMWHYRGIRNYIYLCLRIVYAYSPSTTNFWNFLFSMSKNSRKEEKQKNPHQTTRSLDLCFLMHLDIAICISDIFC